MGEDSGQSAATRSTRQQVEEQGFAVIPFPVKALQAMRAHIAKHLSQVLGREDCGWNRIEELGAACAQLERSVFEAHIGKQASRIYPAEVSRLIRDELRPHLGRLCEVEQIDLLKALSRHVADNPRIGHDAYFCYWRFVIPGEGEATPAHADSQYNQIHEEHDEHLESSIAVDKMWKLWVPLFNCTEDNSLQIIPGSHLERVPWSRVLVDGRQKPQIDADWLAGRETEFVCPIGGSQGFALLFGENLVHRGPANRSHLPRISSDFEVALSARAM